MGSWEVASAGPVCSLPFVSHCLYLVWQSISLPNIYAPNICSSHFSCELFSFLWGSRPLHTPSKLREGISLQLPFMSFVQGSYTFWFVFSPVNLSYVNLIAKEPRKEEGQSFPPLQYQKRNAKSKYYNSDAMRAPMSWKMTADTQHHASHMANVQSTTECWIDH